MADLARQRLGERVPADALFVSCTNLRGVADVLLQKLYDVPVVIRNHAAREEVRRASSNAVRAVLSGAGSDSSSPRRQQPSEAPTQRLLSGEAACPAELQSIMFIRVERNISISAVVVSGGIGRLLRLLGPSSPQCPLQRRLHIYGWNLAWSLGVVRKLKRASNRQAVVDAVSGCRCRRRAQPRRGRRRRLLLSPACRAAPGPPEAQPRRSLRRR